MFYDQIAIIEWDAFLFRNHSIKIVPTTQQFRQNNVNQNHKRRNYLMFEELSNAETNEHLFYDYQYYNPKRKLYSSKRI